MRWVQAWHRPGRSLCSCAPALCPHSLAALRTHSARLTQGQKAAFARRLLQAPFLGAVPTWPLGFLRAVLPLLPHLPLRCFLQLTPQQVGCEPLAPTQAALPSQHALTPRQAGIPTLHPVSWDPCTPSLAHGRQGSLCPRAGNPTLPNPAPLILHPPGWDPCTPLAPHAEPTALAGSPRSGQEA